MKSKMLIGIMLVGVMLMLSASCGKPVETQSSATIVNTPQTQPVTEMPSSKLSLTQMNYNASHTSYIIGGQSNAVRLLYTETGQNVDNDTHTSDIIPLSNTNITGYAIGGTGIEYWLISDNTIPLLNIIKAKCSTNPYFIWYQGESDATVTEYKYRTNLITFFNSIIAVCPNIAIIEVSIAVQQAFIDNEPLTTDLISIQQSLGIPYVDAMPFLSYGSYGTNHLIQLGYEALWNQIISQFPLNN